MNLTSLIKQYKDKFSNYHFIKLTLVTNYFVDILNLYGFSQVLVNKTLNNDEKFLFIKDTKITFKGNYKDLQHAKHDALIILDKLEDRFNKEFNLDYVVGNNDGNIYIFLKNSTYVDLIRVNFKKTKNRVVMSGIINLSNIVINLMDQTNTNFEFSPFQISLFPIQLNNKELIAYGKQVDSKLAGRRYIHDLEEINHTEKTTSSVKTKIPFILTYGLKDINDKTINITSTFDKKFYRIKLKDISKFKFDRNKQKIEIKNNYLYICDSKKCNKDLSIDKTIFNLKTFDQSITDEKCRFCSSKASTKFISIKVGEPQ
jgi:hypothetical protein